MDKEAFKDSDYEALRQIYIKFVDNGLIYNNFYASLEVVDDDVIGIGMGEQGYYLSKAEMLDIYNSTTKESSDNDVKNFVEYGKIDIRIFSSDCASVSGEIHLKTQKNDQIVTYSFLQMTSARKKNGKWLFYMIMATPLTLTEDGIESYPLTFADNMLAHLREELQSDTFDLMNQSFSGGILGTYVKQNYPLYFANDSLIEMLGYEREEFEKVFADNTSKLNYVDDFDDMRKISSEGEKVAGDFGSRVRWIKKDGSIIWIEFRTRKTKDDYGNDIFLTVAIDVSETINLQEKTKKQHETIMSSIDYASRIQQNMLPRRNSFEEIFSDFSVIWKPRDVVGGDVYWLKNFEEGSVLCVCDCTGHGTPGALLTMLVVSTFETVIDATNYKDTAEIIWKLEKRLTNVLNVNTSSKNKRVISDIKDGCDLAVIYTSKEGNVSVSSANIHVFVCDGKEVTQIKGQKLYIGEGILEDKNDIKVVTIPPNNDNKFYVASDGLYDQIGDKTELPFGYKALKNVILENHNEKQDIILEKIWQKFENYRGNQPRRDDVELIAFRP